MQPAPMLLKLSVTVQSVPYAVDGMAQPFCSPTECKSSLTTAYR